MPEALDVMTALLGDRPAVQSGSCLICGREYPGDIDEGDCPADDCPSTRARAFIPKLHALMDAVKHLLLNQIDRDEHRYLEEEGKDERPTEEFALLFVAYADAGGNLRQDNDTYDWPEWAQDLLQDCKDALKKED